MSDGMKSRTFSWSLRGFYCCCIIVLVAVCLTSVSMACAQVSVNTEVGNTGEKPLIVAQPMTVMRPSFYQQFVQLIPMFTIVMVIYYLMVLRPKVSEEKAHKTLVDGLGKGDMVVTSGGILGKIISRSGELFSVEVAKGTVVQIHEERIHSRYTVTESKSA